MDAGADQTVVVNEFGLGTFTISASASGTGALTYAWTENGVPLMHRPWFRRRFAELQMRLMELEANSARQPELL